MAEARAGGAGVGRMPALDGIRAFAVLAVISYHCGVPWMTGGFYGVDAFLVLSGFLITSLLVAEWDGSGSISLTGFWARRARRLFPALLLMLCGVALVVGLFPGVLSVTHLFTDSVATILYVANWHLAAEHASYFGAVNAPSPLMHTWTLAIEEQFYVLWPLVVMGVMRLRRRGTPAYRATRLRALLAVAFAGAAASAVWMMVLAPTDGSDPSRAYYGSDTRAQGLLIGAALAVACALWGPVRTRLGARLLGAAGVGGAVGVALIWGRVAETSGFAFHGGFLVVTLACAAVVAAAARVPSSPVGRLLSLSPLRYLGRISYGMYLWYWPVLLVLTGQRTHVHGYALLLVRLTVVVSVAALSFHLVETPIRRGAFLSGWRARVAAPAGALATASAMLLATTVAPAAAAAAAPPRYLVSSPAASTQPAPIGTQAPNGVQAAAPGGAGSAPSGTAPAPAATGVTRSRTAGGGPGSGRAGTSATSGSSGAGAPRAPASSAVVPGSGPGGPGAVRILLVGDSMAGSLGVGLSDAAPALGAEVVNEGQPGCSLSMQAKVRVLWYTLDPGRPCTAGDPGALLDSWRTWVDRYNPDVVVYLARSEVLDQQYQGQWSHLGQPGFDAWVAGRFRQAVSVLGARGARVVFLTSPAYSTGEQSSGDAWPEDDPARVASDNSIIRAAAADSGATVVDAGGLLSPGGTYVERLDGVQMRCSDGVHITRSGGRWLGRAILPGLVALGAPRAAGQAGRTPLGPAAAPWWWANVPCNV